MSINSSSIKLTVFFEDPFWVGVFEKTRGNEYQVARIVFGPEPKVYDIAKMLDDYYHLKFSKVSVDSKQKPVNNLNPKRMQRLLNRNQKKQGVGTAAQEAMRLQREVDRKDKKRISKAQREEIKNKKYEQKQQKKKEKKRGH